nr:MAG TPA: hypothetical protein [Caudoviricetes sp.]
MGGYASHYITTSILIKRPSMTKNKIEAYSARNPILFNIRFAG